jgi:hypothetical protein
MEPLTGMGQTGRNNCKSWNPSQEWVIAADIIPSHVPSHKEGVRAAEIMANHGPPEQKWVRAAEIMTNHGPPHRNGSDRQE